MRLGGVRCRCRPVSEASEQPEQRAGDDLLSAGNGYMPGLSRARIRLSSRRHSSYRARQGEKLFAEGVESTQLALQAHDVYANGVVHVDYGPAAS